MKLIIRGDLALERQDIELSDSAVLVLELGAGQSLNLRRLPMRDSDYTCIEVMVHSPMASGGALLQPTSGNVINYLIPAERKAG